MTNQEIINKLNKLDQQRLNACDFYLELKAFNKDYKKSDFYKQTHMSLINLVKLNREQRYFKYTDMNTFFIDLQEHIEDLDVDNLIKVLDKAQNVLGEDYAKNVELINTIISNFSQGGISEVRGE